MLLTSLMVIHQVTSYLGGLSIYNVDELFYQMYPVITNSGNIFDIFLNDLLVWFNSLKLKYILTFENSIFRIYIMMFLLIKCILTAKLLS